MSRIFRVVIFPIVALFVSSQILSAQAPKTEKRIYLLDLTGSMEGRGGVHTPNILQTVKDNLAATIENIDDPNTEIVIIPFTNVPHNAIEGVASIKDSLITQIQKLGVRSGDTNIADAWSEGIKNLDNSKINYLFLLTDGLHNTGPSKQVLFERLRKWGETAPGNNEYAFYVMLTPNAKETEICEIVDSTSQMWLIESMDINASLIRTAMNQRKNVFSNPSTSISFFSNNRNTRFEDLGLQVSFEENDFYYVDNLKKSVVGDIYTFDIFEKLPKIQMPLDTTLTLRLSYDKEKNPFVYLTPEVISFRVINQGPRILTVSVQNSKKGLKDLNLRKLKYKEPFQGYFRWTRKFYEPTFGLAFMSRPDTASTSTNFILNWNEEAIRAGASVKFNLTTLENKYGDHIQVSNGDNDIAFVARTESDTLCLKTTIIPGIPSTRFSGDIVALTNNLDTINETELTTDEADMGNWRLQYKKSWPFWIWLFWLLLTAAAVAVTIWLIRLCIKGVVGLSQVRASQRLHSTASQTVSKKSKKSVQQRKDINDKKEKRDDCPCIDSQFHLCHILRDKEYSIAQKCQALVSLADLWEMRSQDENTYIYKRLCPKVKNMLEDFWAIPKMTPNTDASGCWKVGEKGNGTYYFNNNKSFSSKNTRNNMNWGQLVDAYKKDFHLKVDGGVKYKNFRIDLKPYAIASVKVKYEDSNMGRGGGHGVQDIAEKQFAALLKKEIESGGYADFWEYKDGIHNGAFVRNTPLVIHEDYDGETLLLVPKYLHDNWKHYGGISVVSVVKKYL